jgi:hypothetical protein
MSTQPIPWSAERELKLRRWITFGWFAMWLGFLSAIAAWLLGHEIFSVFFVAAALANLYCVNRYRAELGEEMRRLPNGQFYEGSGMLANKPRSTANLTKWTQWADAPFDEPSLFFWCNGCGKRHEWAAAQWIPNYDGDPEDIPLGTPMYFDPGGGRYVILCPCGLGHYKLKA